MTPQDLVEIHHIEQLKFRYLRHLDCKEWDDLTTCFVPDATATYGSVPALDGRATGVWALEDRVIAVDAGTPRRH